MLMYEHYLNGMLSTSLVRSGWPRVCTASLLHHTICSKTIALHHLSIGTSCITRSFYFLELVPRKLHLHLHLLFILGFQFPGVMANSQV